MLRCEKWVIQPWWKIWRLSVILPNASNLLFRFLIEDGSNAPRLRLRLLVGDINPNSLSKTRLSLDDKYATIWALCYFSLIESSVLFLPWSYLGTYIERPHVDISRHESATAPFTFSNRLSNLQSFISQLPENRRLILTNLFGQCESAQIHWAYSDSICHNFEFQEKRMEDRLRAEIQQWRVEIDNFKILSQVTAVNILTPHLCSSQMALALDRSIEWPDVCAADTADTPKTGMICAAWTRFCQVLGYFDLEWTAYVTRRWTLEGHDGDERTDAGRLWGPATFHNWLGLHPLHGPNLQPKLFHLNIQNLSIHIIPVQTIKVCLQERLPHPRRLLAISQTTHPRGPNARPSHQLKTLRPGTT